MIGYLRARRTRRDVAIAAFLTAVVVAVVAIIYVKSDARATTLDLGQQEPAPAPMTVAPTSLEQIWSLESSSSFPAVVSPYGTVITSDEHSVTAFDYLSGAERWSYGRSNVDLCALGSADTAAGDLKAQNGLHGLLVAFSKGDHCSEISLLSPVTGERLRQRTAAPAADSALTFGGPYGGLVSDDLVELWRFDLVRTIQYGNQPTPTGANTRHLGCTFTDLAVTDTQFATIEHCENSGSHAQLVVNYADPGNSVEGKEKKWDGQRFSPRSAIDLGTDSARILSITQDRVAVLVASPEPAVVVYENPQQPDPDATTDANSTPEPVGTESIEISRTVLPIDPAVIAEMDTRGPVSPVTFGDNVRYALVGDTLIAIDSPDLTVKWYLSGVLGTPAVIGENLLIPRATGIAVTSAASGQVLADIPVDRAGYDGRVDVHTVGSVIVENRGNQTVGLRSPDAPPMDASIGATTSTGVAGTLRLPGTG